MRNSGILLAYIVGALLDYSQIPFVFICLPFLFIVNFWFLPSTPQYLIRCGHFEVTTYIELHPPNVIDENGEYFQEAKQSLKFYRGCSSRNLEQLQALNLEFEQLIVFTA